MPNTTYDTVVVGGGMSGLVCALLQARKGQRVMLVEKGPHLSPTLWGFERQGTYLDTGFHYAGAHGADGLLRHLLQKLHMEEALAPDLVSTDIYDRVRFQSNDLEVPFAQGWAALETGLIAAFPKEATGITSFLRTVRSLWEEGSGAFKTSYGHDLGPLFGKEGPSLEQAITDATSDPYLQSVLGCHAVLYGTSASDTSMVFHSQVVGSYYESSCVYRGGGRRWVQVFIEALKDAGVDVRCGYGVTEIMLNEAGHVCGVVLEDDTRVITRHCISTVHPKTLLTLLPKEVFRPVYRRRIHDLQETASAVVLFGRGTAPTKTGNLILIDDPQSIWDWQERPLTERPLFVSAPDGQESGGMSVICPATLADIPDLNGHKCSQRPDTYRAWKDTVAQALLTRLQAHAGDMIEGFELLATASPVTFRDWVGSPAGGIYGVQHRQEEMPLLPQTRVPGLYLSGQGVVAPGVLGALCAGFLTESCVA